MEKKIIIGSFLVLILLLLMPSIPAIQQMTIEDKAPPQYLILLFGKCEKITLNNQTDAYGKLKGDLLIYNKHVFGTIENYWIFALDKYNNKIHTKKSLPKKFTLIDFTGYGMMRWIPYPHSPCSQFFIIGKAQYMIEHE